MSVKTKKKIYAFISLLTMLFYGIFLVLGHIFYFPFALRLIDINESQNKVRTLFIMLIKC